GAPPALRRNDVSWRDFPRLRPQLNALFLHGETMQRLTRSCSATLLLLFVATSAWAQFTEYTTPGGPDGRPADRKGQLEREAEAARPKAGPLRIAPTIELKDVEYVQTLLGSAGNAQPTDFTATVAGGARFYLPLGTRAMWTAYALPEYVWWQK